jgi:hypothetical protein
VSNLSIGTGLVIIVPTRAHLTRVSPLSRPGIGPLSGQLSENPW